MLCSSPSMTDTPTGKAPAPYYGFRPDVFNQKAKGSMAEVAERKAHKQDGWTPVRDGELYCSPLCGGGCTYASYEAAVLKAQEMCGQLGEGWKPAVFENMAWHAQVQKGVAQLSYSGSGNGSYVLTFGIKSELSQLSGQGDSPREAVHDAFSVVRSMLVDAIQILGDGAWGVSLPPAALPEDAARDVGGGA